MAKQHLTSAELLAKLVSFDTTSRNSNLDLIEFAAERFPAATCAKRLMGSGVTGPYCA